MFSPVSFQFTIEIVRNWPHIVVSMTLLFCSVLHARVTLDQIREMEIKRSFSKPKLLEGMKSFSPETARAALLALGHTDENSAVTDIADLISRKRVPRSLKINAIQALGLMRQPDAGKVLAQNLSMFGDPLMISAILSALGQFGELKHLDSVMTILRTEKDPAILHAALAATGRIIFQSPRMRIPLPGDVAGRLFTILKEPNTDNALLACTILLGLPGNILMQKEDAILEGANNATSIWLQQKLYLLLAKTNSEKGLNFFLQQAENEKRLSLRLTAISLLPPHIHRFPQQRERANEILRVQLKHPEMLVKLVSLRALRDLEKVDARVEPHLLEILMKDPSPSVKAEAMHVLVRLQPEKTSEILKTNSLNTDLPVRRKIAEILAKGASETDWETFLSDEKAWENIRSPLVDEYFWNVSATVPDSVKSKLIEQHSQLDRRTQAVLSYVGQRFNWDLPEVQAPPEIKNPELSEIRKWKQSRASLLSPRGKFQLELNNDTPLSRYLIQSYLGTAKQALVTFESQPPESVTLLSAQGLPWLAPQEWRADPWVERGEVILSQDTFDPSLMHLSIRLAPQLLVDRRSTVVGRIIKGMDTVEHLEVGDEIRLSP